MVPFQNSFEKNKIVLLKKNKRQHEKVKEDKSNAHIYPNYLRIKCHYNYLIKYLYIIFLFIFIKIVNSQIRQINSYLKYSEITLKINGYGEKQVIDTDFCPDYIYINDDGENNRLNPQNI